MTRFDHFSSWALILLFGCLLFGRADAASQGDGWSVLEPGPVQGISLAVQGPKTKGKHTQINGMDISWDVDEGTLLFLVQLPSGTTHRGSQSGSSVVIIDPEGDEDRVSLSSVYGRTKSGYDQLPYSCVIIPPLYRAGCPYLDVRIKLPGKPQSVFRLTKLVATKDWFDRRVATGVVEIGHAKVSASVTEFKPKNVTNWHPLQTRLLATGLPPDQHWEWREVRLAFPYGVSAPMGGFVTDYSDVTDQIKIGRSLTTASHLRECSLVRVTGILARYEAVEEELDFGDVPIAEAIDNGVRVQNKYRANISDPISRTTPTGFTLAIVPEGNPPSFFMMGSQAPALCLDLKNSPLDAGFVKDGVALRIEVRFGNVVEELRPSALNARHGLSHTMFYPDIPKGATSIHVKLIVKRKLYFEEHPFELYVPNPSAAKR